MSSDDNIKDLLRAAARVAKGDDDNALLPVELFVHIIGYAIKGENVLKSSPVKRVTCLRRVSRTWCSTIDRFPELWNVVGSAIPKSVLLDVLERSKPKNLLVFLDNSRDSTWTALEDVAPHIDRWELVHVLNLSAAQVSVLCDSPAPNLRSCEISLSSEDDTVQDVRYDLFAGQAPRLESLTSNLVELNWSSVVLRDLKWLDITACRLPNRAQLRTILSNCPRLEYLRAVSLVAFEGVPALASSPLRPIRTPSLRDVYLEMSSEEAYAWTQVIDVEACIHLAIRIVPMAGRLLRLPEIIGTISRRLPHIKIEAGQISVQGGLVVFETRGTNGQFSVSVPVYSGGMDTVAAVKVFGEAMIALGVQVDCFVNEWRGELLHGIGQLDVIHSLTMHGVMEASLMRMLDMSPRESSNEHWAFPNLQKLTFSATEQNVSSLGALIPNRYGRWLNNPSQVSPPFTKLQTLNLVQVHPGVGPAILAHLGPLRSMMDGLGGTLNFIPHQGAPDG